MRRASVAWIDEHRCVASAAVHFTYTGEIGSRWPTREEALAYVADYEAVRGRALDRRRLGAAMIYARAYTAAGAARPERRNMRHAR